MNDTKVELRKCLRSEHQSLTEHERLISDSRLISHLLGHDLFINADRIFLYASVGCEIDTHSLIEHAYRTGKTVALPKCESSGKMAFYQYTGKLIEGKYRIPEPCGMDLLFPNNRDLMIVPGLAFDARGYRIGQGGGYYDRYLADNRCITVAMCRKQFLLKEIPVEWNDLPVDYVITETAVYDCKNGASYEAPF